jgi:hypothetical protein
MGMRAIGISDNGRYFVDGKGAPLFWLGDTQWELFCMMSPEDAAAVLERRKAQGFSAILVMITGVGDGSKPNAAGQTPWVNHDPAHPNEAYFRNMDRVVDLAGKLGLILVPGVYHQVQRSVITMGNARGYARWLGERYRDVPHIIWATYPEAKEEFVPILREIAAGLREGDGGAHLITCHPDPSVTSSSFIHTDDWLDFNMIQTCVDYGLICKMVGEDYARTPVKPTIMAEGGYEGLEFGRTQTALEIRKQAYWSYLAGGHHCYGHNDNWISPRTWRSWIDSPGAQSMTVCRRILTSLPRWWGMVPDQSLFVSGEGSWVFQNVAARSPAGNWALAYLVQVHQNSPVTFSIAMDRACSGRALEAHWIAPTTGARTPIGRLPGAGVQDFTTPDGWDDALLLLEGR